jgi:hypothetical protein
MMKKGTSGAKCDDEESKKDDNFCPFSSCLHLPDDWGSTEEVAKPLYYIIDEVSSQQVREFMETSTKEERYQGKNGFCGEDQTSSPGLFARPRFVNLFHTRRRCDSETASVTRVESAITFTWILK